MQVSIAHWAIIIGYIAVFIIPVAVIVGKAGYSKWWCIISVVPLVNILFLWIFAFAKWPARRQIDVATFE